MNKNVLKTRLKSIEYYTGRIEELKEALTHAQDVRKDIMMELIPFIPFEEGDIIKSVFFPDECVLVVWDQEFAQFLFGGAEFGVEICPKNLEVLGNIHDNPEPLKTTDHENT